MPLRAPGPVGRLEEDTQAIQPCECVFGTQDTLTRIDKLREFRVVAEWLQAEAIAIFSYRLDPLGLIPPYFPGDLSGNFGLAAEIAYERGWQDTAEDGVAVAVIVGDVVVGEGERQGLAPGRALF